MTRLVIFDSAGLIFININSMLNGSGGTVKKCQFNGNEYSRVQTFATRSEELSGVFPTTKLSIVVIFFLITKRKNGSLSIVF